MKRACIVLPAYNEASSLNVLIPSIFDGTSSIPNLEMHVLVVDDRSPDGSAGVVRELQAAYRNLHLLSGPKKGLGDAYRRGFAWALSNLAPDLVFQMDADLQHDPSMIPEFVKKSRAGYTLVIGSRFVEKGRTPGYSAFRRCQSKMGSWLIRTVMGVRGVRDCTSGYRCIDAGLLARCDLGILSSDGFSFQGQLLDELVRNGAKWTEIPIIFRRREYGHSKLSNRDRIGFLADLLTFRFGGRSSKVKKRN